LFAPMANMTTSSFKPLSGIHLARTVFDGTRTKHWRTKFQTPVGNSSRAHQRARNTDARYGHVSNPCREFISRAHGLDTGWMAICERVSNPCREFISRARGAAFPRNGGAIRFKPLSGIHLARTPPPMPPAPRFGRVSNPCREFISRALQMMSNTANVQSGFKPLSGIHLARTQSLQPRKRKSDRFQTPVGNSSRAHEKWASVMLATGCVSNPCREFISRAHWHDEYVTSSKARSFKPLSGIHLARTERRKCAHPPACRVSNPCREFISRARARA